jgi:hypothetical protein
MTTHLVIPDSHAHPDHSNLRYEILGHLITDIKPDVVIDIGDWFDMPSLCEYDKGTKSFEGRRYSVDIAAGVEAQDRMMQVIRRQKKLPRFIRCLGNHENRINRAIEKTPILHGTISTKDLQSREYGWEEHSFLEPVEVDGVVYQHYFPTGVMNKPTGGVNPAKALVDKQHVSCTQGHDHRFNHYRATTPLGRKINGLLCGVFVDYEMDYAGPANQLWDSGVVVKRCVENGDYDLEWISWRQMEYAYV